MEYKDKQIVMLRNHQKKNRYVDSLTGMYADELLLKFHRINLFQYFEIMVPDIFITMDADTARKKYPSENRPQIILTEESGQINFTFSLLKSDMDSVDGAMEQYKIMLMAVQPANQFMDRGHVDGQDSCWMEFKSFAVDGPIYNLLSLTGFQDKAILGMFNCPYEKWITWKPIMLELLNTLCQGEEQQ